jgi:hypothetical protein
MAKVKFFLPGVGEQRLRVLNGSLVDKLEKYPHMFRDVEVGAVYGHYPGIPWSGGRFSNGYATYQDVYTDLAFYNNTLNIPVRYTFTNTLITEELLSDQFGNIVLMAADNGMNEVLVNNDIFENYVRTNYPSFKICASTTKRITTKEQYDQYKGKYDYIVLDYSFNKKPEIFDLEDKEHIELLIMTFCWDNCPNRMHHQYVTNYSDLNLFSSEQHYGMYTCPFFRDKNWTFHDHMKMHTGHIIDPDELYDKYVPAGFINMKLEGRGNDIYDVMESYLWYMVLPEYRNELRLMLAKDIAIGSCPQMREQQSAS